MGISGIQKFGKKIHEEVVKNALEKISEGLQRTNNL